MQRATQDTNYDLLAGKAVFTLAPHLLILSLFKRGALFQGIQYCCRLRAGFFFTLRTKSCSCFNLVNSVSLLQ